uniref:Major facilitator superfamily (MFS) profile domain-containing protein n=1 Tax=Pyrodinium bahamense TaxID=73915 RepID=A0A7S0A7E1_9DINO
MENVSGLSDRGRTSIGLDEVLTAAGVGHFQLRLLIACGLGFAAAAVEVVLTGFLLTSLRREWHSSEYMLSMFPTFITLGAIVGELLWGRVADHYGRRAVFMVTVIIVVVFGMASALSWNMGSLIALRFFVAFGYGGNISVDFTLFCELCPTQGRGTMLFALSFFWPLGQILATALAWLVIPRLDWRAFLIFCAIPSLLTCFLRPLIPESPRWLLLHGYTQEAVDVCCHIAKMNGKTPTDVGLSKDTKLVLWNEAEPFGKVSEHQPKSSPSVMVLLGKDLRSTFTACLIFHGLLSLGGYATSTFMPSFLAMKGMSRIDAYLSMLLSSLAEIPGVFLAAAAGIYLGRRLPIQVSPLLVACALIIFAFARRAAVMMVFSCMASCCLEFGWAFAHVYVPEAFPTELRATATGAITGFGSLTSMATPVVTAWILEATNAGAGIAVAFFAIALALGSLVLFMLLRLETVNRELQDWASDSSAF